MLTINEIGRGEVNQLNLFTLRAVENLDKLVDV